MVFVVVFDDVILKSRVKVEVGIDVDVCWRYSWFNGERLQTKGSFEGMGVHSKQKY